MFFKRRRDSPIQNSSRVHCPEDTAAMTAAFEEALKRLNVADREAPMATSVAKKIVRLAKKGECNPTRLTEGVISSLRANP